MKCQSGDGDGEGEGLGCVVCGGHSEEVWTWKKWKPWREGERSFSGMQKRVRHKASASNQPVAGRRGPKAELVM